MKFCVLFCLKMDNFLIYNDNTIQTFVVIKKYNYEESKNYILLLYCMLYKCKYL
jgi:hypothetical protein